MSKDNSGPAFPTGTREYDGQGNVLPSQVAGMSLREYIATEAMAAYISGHIAHYGHENHWPVDSLSSEAYSMADAMLKASEAV